MRTLIASLALAVLVGGCSGAGNPAGPVPLPGPGPGPGPATPPAGADCLVAADCQSGVCEGLGCGDDLPGVCAEAQRGCTRDRRAYCGCDGVTFFSSGSCPGQRFSRRGECVGGAPAGGAPRAAGQHCTAAADCDSGICEGQGCGADEGTCAAAGRRCTADLRPFCGCDGQTFRSSSSCPGRRFDHPGDCP